LQIKNQVGGLMAGSKEYQRNYHKENREKELLRMKEYNEQNKEKIKLRKAKYRKDNNKAILIKEKEKYKLKHKTYQTNKNLNLNIDEKRKRYNARAYARKKPMDVNCQICKSLERLERHHWNYNKPLLFATLCNTCHGIQHIRNFGGSKFGR